VHGCLIADFTASRLGGGGPAARTAHARACTTKHAARHRFAGWSEISARQRTRRFRRDVLQTVHSQLRRLVCIRRWPASRCRGWPTSAAATMRPRRARRIVAPGCGRALRGGTCTFTAWRWRGARRARPRRARCIVAPGCGRAWRGGTCTFTVWRWRGARRARGARGACGAAVSGVARRWAASRWRRCGCAGRGASLRPAAAAHGEEVRALAHERSDAEAGS